MSTSHEWAKKLRETADVLESRPNVDMRGDLSIPVYFVGKDNFLAAVRALKPGKKHINDNYVKFYPEGTVLTVYADRNTVCKKVQEARWECEPLLSPEEEAEIETVASSDIPF